MSALRGLALPALCLAGMLCTGCEAIGLNVGSGSDAQTPMKEAAPNRGTPWHLAETRLAAAAERAEAALNALARVRAAGTPMPEGTVPPDVPADLRRRVTLDWIGPLEMLARSLAAHAGYRFEAAGAEPVRPLMVTIAAKDAPLIEVLRDAGLQAGAAATLTVDAARRTVRLDWSGEHPGPGEHPGAAQGQEGA